MTRLEVWCIVALLAYGLAVGCWDGTHRETCIVEVTRTLASGEVRTWRLFKCPCVSPRVPYHEVYR